MSGQFSVDGIRGQLLDPDGGAIGNIRARVLLDAHDDLDRVPSVDAAPGSILFETTLARYATDWAAIAQ